MRFLLVLIAVTSLSLSAETWNARLAAEYLDARQKEWFAWRNANAPGGPCVSCHTGLTYLLARPALRRALKETDRTPYETGLANGLRARTGALTGKDVFAGFAKEPLAGQAVGVESVLAALLLTLESEARSTLSPDAEKAFSRMWSLQIREGPAKGSWSWFSLNLDPWEMPESPFYGASLAAAAVGAAPKSYRNQPDVAPKVADLVQYLRREQASQPLHNRLMLLWASSQLPELLSSSDRKRIVNEILNKQQEDGGWSLQSLGPWKEHPAVTLPAGSHSYATSLAAFVLAKTGSRSSGLRKALAWLRSHQDSASGFWPAESMNKIYPLGSMQSGFMRDAATAYAALALLESGKE